MPLMGPASSGGAFVVGLTAEHAELTGTQVVALRGVVDLRQGVLVTQKSRKIPIFEEPSVSNEHYGIKPILNLVKYSEFHVETDGGNMMKHPRLKPRC